MNETIINVNDIINKVLKKNKYLTDFITPLHIKKIEEGIKMLNKNEEICISRYTQDVELERTKIYIYKASSMEYEIIDYSRYNETFNISIIHIIPNKFAKKLFHKDYLGSILGLGIKREKIGDIIVCDDNSSFVFVSKDILDYVILNLTKIGHENVIVKEVDFIEKEKASSDYKERELTITSYRMDNLIAHALGISRQLSSSLVDKEQVKVNYETNINKLYEIRENDLISIRGYGRVKIVKLDGENKKGRKRVKLHIFKKEK